MSRKGREFELLIKKLEKISFPENTIITSPDYLFDKITNQKREVDISIKFEVGTVSMLIILECRNRNAFEDVTWIEQLHSKTSSLNANNVIAVSSSGFSESAVIKAAHYGIETRTYKDLAFEDISDWFAVETAYMNTQHYNISDIQIDLGDVPIEELEPFSKNNKTEDFITEIKTGDKINAKSIFLIAIQENDIWASIPIDNCVHRRSITVNLNSPHHKFKIETAEKDYPIEFIRYFADFRIETKGIPISNITSYDNSKGSIAQTVEFENALPDKDTVLQLIKTKHNHVYITSRKKQP